jgi:uncharacterized C2H2 Zn-finger protein
MRKYDIRCFACNGWKTVRIGTRVYKCPSCGGRGSIEVKEYLEDIKDHGHLFNRTKDHRYN